MIEEGDVLLLGAESFWKGFDAKGQCLSQVILTRLPSKTRIIPYWKLSRICWKPKIKVLPGNYATFGGDQVSSGNWPAYQVANGLRRIGHFGLQNFE